MARSRSPMGVARVAGCDDAFDVVPAADDGANCPRTSEGGTVGTAATSPGRQRPSSTRKAQIQPKRRRLASDKIARCRLKAALHRVS